MNHLKFFLTHTFDCISLEPFKFKKGFFFVNFRGKTLFVKVLAGCGFLRCKNNTLKTLAKAFYFA